MPRPPRHHLLPKLARILRVTPLLGIPLLGIPLLGIPHPASARPLIVAAENMYGQLAQALAGPDADVRSILANPAADPHSFEPAPSTARAIAGATITLSNGAGYDPWMAKLLAGSPNPARTDLSLATLLHASPGANIHLWYRPDAPAALAAALTAALTRQDPAHAAAYTARAAALTQDFAQLTTRLAALRPALAGLPVAATEPVFSDMAAAMGLHVLETRFATAVMNGAEPRASDVAAFDDDLRRHRVRALITNRQTTAPAIARLLNIAAAAGIPVVTITETMPAGATYQGWLLYEVNTLAAALGQPRA